MAEPHIQEVIQGKPTPLDTVESMGYSNPNGQMFLIWTQYRDITHSGTGWLDGGSIITVEPIHLYAQWGWRVTWNANGGTSPYPSSTVVDGYVFGAGNLPQPTRSGFSFLGWYTDPTGGSKFDGTEPITGHRTFYAHWKGNVYTKSSGFTDVQIARHATWSGDSIIYKKLPKGTYTIQFNNIYIAHKGKETWHKIFMWFRAANSSNTSKVTYLSVPSNYTVSGSSYIHRETGVTRAGGTYSTIYAQGLSRTGVEVTTFNLTLPGRTLPYAQNDFIMDIYASVGDDDCAGAGAGFNSNAKVTFTRTA